MAEDLQDDADEPELGIAQVQSIRAVVLTPVDHARIKRAQRVVALIRSIQAAVGAHPDRENTVAARVNKLVKVPAGRKSLPSQGTPITGGSKRVTQDLGSQLARVREQNPVPSTLGTDPTIDASEVRHATNRGMPAQGIANTQASSPITATGQTPAVDYESLIAATRPGAPDAESADAQPESDIISKLTDQRWGTLLKNAFAAYFSRDSKISPIALANYFLKHGKLQALQVTEPSKLMDSSRSLAEFCITTASRRFTLDEAMNQYHGQLTISPGVSATVFLAQNPAILLGEKKVPVSSMAFIFNTPLFSVPLGGGVKADIDIVQVNNYIYPTSKSANDVTPSAADETFVKDADLQFWFESTQLRNSGAQIIGTNPIISYGIGPAAMIETIRKDAASTWIVLRWLAELLQG